MLEALLKGRLNRLFFDASLDCVKILDLQGRLLEMNPNGRCIMEIDDFGAVRERRWQELWPVEARSLVEQAVNSAGRGESSRFSALCPTAKGTPKWWEVTVTPILDDEGTPSLILSVSREVTTLEATRALAQRHLEEATEARNRLNALLEAAPVGIGYADTAGKLVLVNAANRRLWGEHPMPSEVEGYQEWNGWWADGSARHGQPLRPADWGLTRALRGEEVAGDLVEIEPFDAPGTRKTVLLRAAPVRAQDGRVVGGVVAQMDITDQVRARSELLESEARFRTITEAMPQMVWSTRPDGFHDFYNCRWYEFTGVPFGSTDGEGWSEMFHPEDQAHAWERWRHSLHTGDPYEVEYRLRHNSGEYRWVLGRALPVRDPAGHVTRWMGTCTDIHEQKLAQERLRVSERALRDADRLKDEFLAMLAHELRNPLAPIGAAAELLRIAGGERVVQDAAAVIKRQVHHMTELVDDLLDVSRVTRGVINLHMTSFDVTEVAQAALEQVRPLLESRQHRVSVRLEPANITGDRTRVVQVIANLLNNAAKYTAPGGLIELTSTCSGNWVEVAVRDNGCGIGPDFMPHVFELFSQAGRQPDRTQGGLGIGLALVGRLMKLHGGAVAVDSPGIGQGSTFTLRFAVAAGAAAIDADEGVQSAAPTEDARSLHICVVDDNEDAAVSMAALLGLLGHHVEVFNTAEQLLEADRRDAYDVFLLDIGLPGMTGLELARRLRAQLASRAKLFALSGYGDQHDIAASRDSGFDDHFVKPVAPEVLFAKLQP